MHISVSRYVILATPTPGMYITASVSYIRVYCTLKQYIDRKSFKINILIFFRYCMLEPAFPTLFANITECLAMLRELSGVDRLAQTRLVQHSLSIPTHIHLHAPPNPTCSQGYDLERLKADFKPESLHPPPPTPGPKRIYTAQSSR